MPRNWKKLVGIAAAVVLVVGFAAKQVYNKVMADYMQTGALILEYHSISERKDWDPSLVIAPAVFERELQVLQKEGYKMVTVAELGDRLARGESVDKYIALSFDDGYKDNYTNAFPLLKKYDAKATFAIIDNRIDGDVYMTEADIKELQAAGMEIGSHTISHNPLAEIEPKYLEWEIGVSKYKLEQRFPGAKVTTLAYPNGSYNNEIIAALKKYGYKQALTGHTGMNDAAFYKEHPMELNRVIVLDDGKGQYYFSGLIKRAYRRSFFLQYGIDLGE